MTRKIPPDAFSAYVAMGPERSYQAIAEKFGVSKRAVTRRASSERWSDRLAAVERESQENADRKAVETLDDMNERHLRIAKALQVKALQSLQGLPLEQAKDIIRALELGVKQERLVRGEPTERQSTVEEIVKREYAEWMETDADGEGSA